jgi:hypothetical protein
LSYAAASTNGTELSVVEQAAQSGLNWEAQQMFANDQTAADGGRLTTEKGTVDAVAALTGAYELIRDTIDLLVPTAAASDEVIRDVLYGTDQLANNVGGSSDTVDGELAALSAKPSSTAESNWLSAVSSNATALSNQVNGYLTAQAADTTATPDLTIDETLAHLNVGASLVIQTSWTISPSPLSLDQTVGGATSGTVTVTNTSLGRAVTITPTITGSGAAAFTVTSSTCPTTPAPLASCTLTVAFQPPSVGTLTAQLNLGTPGGGQGPSYAELAGTAVSATAPLAPIGVIASPGVTSATVAWTPPTGAAPTGYVVTVNPGGQKITATGTATSAVVGGLTDGATYTFTVTATNTAGSGLPSTPSNPATPNMLPNPPTAVHAKAQDGAAVVTWAQPVETAGAPPLLGYQITTSPGGAVTTVGAQASSATITGLTNDDTYTFTVAAVNPIGVGGQSALSNSVTPIFLPDGTFVSYQGAVYRLAGGAPLYVSNWNDVGGPQPTVTLNQSEWDTSLNAVPVSGTLISDTSTQMVYKIAGGAPLYVSNWNAIGGGPQPTIAVDDWDLTNITNPASHLNAMPANGTLIRDTSTQMVYKIAGGAPLYVSNWNAIGGGPQPTIAVDDWDLTNITNPASHLYAIPANGTALTTLAGRYYQVVNGYPIIMSTSLSGAVLIDSADISNAGQQPPWNHLL